MQKKIQKPHYHTITLLHCILNTLPFVFQGGIEFPKLILHAGAGFIDLGLDLGSMFLDLFAQTACSFGDLFLDLGFRIIDLTQSFSKPFGNTRKLVRAKEQQDHNNDHEDLATAKI